jgi:hypothetical protein
LKDHSVNPTIKPSQIKSSSFDTILATLYRLTLKTLSLSF